MVGSVDLYDEMVASVDTSMEHFTSSSFFNASAAVVFLFSSSSVTIFGSKNFQFTNHQIRVEVTGKSVNRGVGLGLEIPVNYFFMEMQEL